MPWVQPSHYDKTYRKDAKKRYDESGRDPAIRKLYNSRQWRNLRNAYKSEHPICEDCQKQLADHVHHIVPLKQDMTKALDWGNLKSLCKACHAKAG